MGTEGEDNGGTEKRGEGRVKRERTTEGWVTASFSLFS